MTQKNNFIIRSIHPALLVTSILVGAALALLLIAAFVLPVEGNPEWGKLWKIRPLVIVPIAGAVGGGVFYLLRHRTYQAGWRKILVTALGALVYIIGLWLGTVLGLDGTLWD